MSINDNKSIGFTISDFAPFDPMVHHYFIWSRSDRIAIPYEYTGWMNETLSWKKNCYIHTHLSDITEAVPIKGPDAEKLLSHMCVNNFSIDKFPVGRAKHIISCTPIGTIAGHGMCLRLGKDDFVTYCIKESVDPLLFSGEYDVETYEPDLTRDFIFQLAGPKSLEIVENAIKRDIHDLMFMEFRDVDILGYPVRVLRMGMGGSLAYEIHGSTEHIFEIYNEIIRVGQPYGITKLGVKAYMCNHTENGFPQNFEHFLSDFENDPKMVEFFQKAYQQPEEDEEDEGKYSGTWEMPLYGSLAEMGKNAYYSNPIECGWGKMINWDHEFIGKEALKKIADDPCTRQVVTLEWNPEDLLKIYATWFDDEPEIAKIMEMPQDYDEARNGCLADKVVDVNGNYIGKSTGRIYTLYYKKVISMAFLDPEYAELGKEVTVIWGEPGTRQIPVRATVARYPYLDMPRNADYDIESIPHYQG